MAEGDTLLHVGGSKTAFRCQCGSNVFQKISRNGNMIKYRCNGCSATYTAEGEEKGEKVKVYDPDTIRKSIQRNAAMNKPEEFSQKARGAVLSLYNAELAKLPGVLKGLVDETRYLIWGYMLCPTDEPFHPLRSADLLPPQFNALGLWATERVGGEFRMRESFPEELAWALTKARVIRTAMEHAAFPITFGELLNLYQNITGPIEIDGRNAREPGTLPGDVAYALQRGGDISAVVEDAQQPAAPIERPAPKLYVPPAQPESQAGEFDPGF